MSNSYTSCLAPNISIQDCWQDVHNDGLSINPLGDSTAHLQIDDFRTEYHPNSQKSTVVKHFKDLGKTKPTVNITNTLPNDKPCSHSKAYWTLRWLNSFWKLLWTSSKWTDCLYWFHDACEARKTSHFRMKRNSPSIGSSHPENVLRYWTLFHLHSDTDPFMHCCTSSRSMILWSLTRRLNEHMKFITGHFGIGCWIWLIIHSCFHISTGMQNGSSSSMVPNGSDAIQSLGHVKIGGIFRWLDFLCVPAEMNWLDVVFKSKLPKGATPLFIIVYANKSHLSSFGAVKGYPVVAHLANLDDPICNGESIGGGEIVGWLPIVGH